MHEASIAQSILDIVQAKCREAGCDSITCVRVRIGKAAGVLPEALIFAFDAFKEDTVAKGATLEIESVPVAGTCNDCKKHFTAPDNGRFVFACPHCGSTLYKISQGREMEIIEMEANE